MAVFIMKMALLLAGLTGIVVGLDTLGFFSAIGDIVTAITNSPYISQAVAIMADYAYNARKVINNFCVPSVLSAVLIMSMLLPLAGMLIKFGFFLYRLIHRGD